MFFRRKRNVDYISGNAYVIGTQMDPNFVPPSMTKDYEQRGITLDTSRPIIPTSAPPTEPATAPYHTPTVTKCICECHKKEER